MRAIQIEKPKYSNKTIESINDVNNFGILFGKIIQGQVQKKYYGIPIV